MWNPGKTDVRFLEIVSPSGLEKYFVEVDDLMQRGLPDLRRVIEVAQKYGLAFPGPREFFEQIAAARAAGPLDAGRVMELAKKYGVLRDSQGR